MAIRSVVAVQVGFAPARASEQRFAPIPVDVVYRRAGSGRILPIIHKDAGDRPAGANLEPPMHAPVPAIERETAVSVVPRVRPSRVHLRVAHRSPCRLRVHDIDACGETINLSPDGVAVLLGVSIPVGTLVELTLGLAEASPEVITGKVIRSRRVLSGTFELGIRLSTS